MHRKRVLPDTSAVARSLIHYREASHARAMFEIGVTAGSLVLLWFMMRLSLGVGYWLTLLLSVPAAGFLVRLFLIQHDCGHGAFFRHRIVNDWVGRVIGVLTLTPYDYWKRNHAIHHASSSNLDRRGIGDIETLTVQEYRARSWLARGAYRIYRNPLVMFGVGPAYLFFLQHRIPLNQMCAGWKPWLSTMATNVAIILAVACMVWTVGVQTFFLVHAPITLLAASIGVWLFYVQHQYEDVIWAREQAWTLHESALTGSSHYHLPGVLRWFTANIGVHHVHHLNSRIPYYRLPEVLRDHPELKEAGQLTLRQSLRGARLALWDETRQKLISFREMADGSGIDVCPVPSGKD
jgi:omega-6 fatty acid desaturase (delta-12 desaturase)